MKGAPPDMDVQRWNANKGKLLQDLDDAGRLWSWESLSEDGKKILGGGGGGEAIWKFKDGTQIWKTS